MTETAITLFDRARQAVAEAKSIDEVKQIRDQAEALRLYVRQQGESLQMQNDIAEIKLRAERRAGELLREMDKNKGGNPNLLHDETGCSPTLPELGISRVQSHRWQTEAQVPDEEFEQYVAETKANGEELTSTGLRRKAKKLVSDKPNYDGDEWHTPPEYIDAAREVMGDIELDPATCETAQDKIQAKHILTKDDDALLQPWHGRVWLNPPYSMPKIERFVDKLIAEFEQRNVTEAIILVNNSSDTKWFHKLLERFPACFTKGRIRFWHPSHESFATRQGQVFFYLGPDWKHEIFVDTFSQFGIVVRKL